MAIRINLHQLWAQAGYRGTVEVAGNTVGECLERVVKEYPDLGPELFDDEGQLLANMRVFVNGESAFPAELARPLKAGDVIDITPMMAGG